MQIEKKISGALQENILTLLIYDIKSLPLLSNSINASDLDSSIYRDIADKAITFWKNYKKPIKEHLPDELENILSGKDLSKAKLYKETIKFLHENKNTVNREYVLNNLNKFLRLQYFKIGVLKAAELLDQDKIDEAEVVIDKCKKKQISVFDPGTIFKNHSDILKFLDTDGIKVIPTGIKELDQLDICPAPKELFTLAGLSGRGKTWFCIQLVKIATILRKKVLHISLEMSEEKLCKRYIQAYFGIAKRNDKIKIPIFREDELGRLMEFNLENVSPVGSFDQKNIKKFLEKKLSKMKTKNLIIKEFTTGSLTISELKTYLEMLIEYHKFKPDLMIIDEPDLMALNRDNMRLDIRQNYIDIRGIAIDYDLASVCVSQISREGMIAKWLTEKYLAEDFNKMRTSDSLVTVNQTASERTLNLSRLLAVKARDDYTGSKILISQNLAMGQFCLKSTQMISNYWTMIPKDEK